MAKILVVDDELRIREFLHRIFTQKSHEVSTAISAEHALSLVGGQLFDLIITDVLMPGESGLALLKKIRASQNNVPIVVYTGVLTPEMETEARQNGANEVLAKDVSYQVLLERTEKILGAKGRLFESAENKKNTRLLIVDDEKNIRQMLSIFFKKKNFNVREAQDGQEALKLVQVERPDVVLLDMNMPGMNGLQTLQKLLELHPDLGVVMVTAEQNDETVRQAMELGAYGYVIKPFDFLYLELVVTSKLIIAQ